MGPQGTIEDIYGQRNTRYLYRSCHNIGEQIVFSNQLATLWFVLTGKCTIFAFIAAKV